MLTCKPIIPIISYNVSRHVEDVQYPTQTASACFLVTRNMRNITGV